VAFGHRHPLVFINEATSIQREEIHFPQMTLKANGLKVENRNSQSIKSNAFSKLNKKKKTYNHYILPIQ